jgi:hypothetical protein
MSFTAPTPSSKTYVFLLFAFSLASLLSAWLYQQEKEYLSQRPYFYDSATYQYHNIKLEEKAKKEGRFETLKHQFLEDAKQPLRPALMLLIPGWLSNPHGHILILIPILGFFFFRLATQTYALSGSVMLALAAPLFFTALKPVYDPFYGLSAYFLDFFSGIFLALSVMEFRTYTLTEKKSSLFLTGLWIAFTGLSRYEAYVYVFIVLGPFIAWFLLYSKKSEWKTKISQLAYIAAPILILSTYHILHHFRYILDYNEKLNYGLGHGLRDSIWFIRNSFRVFLNPEWILMTLLLAGSGVVMTLKKEGRKALPLIITAVYMFAILPFFWTVVLGTYTPDISYFILFLFPLLPVLVFLYLPLPKISSKPVLFIIPLFAALISAMNANAHYQSLKPVPAKSLAALEIHDFVANSSLKEVKTPFTFACLFREDNHPLLLRFHEKNQVLPSIPDSLVFAIHTNYFPAVYNTSSPDSLKAIISGYMLRNVHFALALEQPEVADTSSQIKEALPKQIAKNLSVYLQTDSLHWKKLDQYHSTLFGYIAVYANRKLNPSLHEH